MQNRYVGDIGDFAKLGLLRHLCGKPEIEMGTSSCKGKLKLGMAWYLHQNQDNGDGRIDTPPDLRVCDTYLYDRLAEIRDKPLCQRSVRDISEGRILPSDAKYHEELLHYPVPSSRPAKEAFRQNWLDGACAALAKAELVFIDPDNGITENESKRYRNSSRSYPGGTKYAYLDELRRFLKEGKSLVIYQHSTHHSRAVEQIRDVSRLLQKNLKLSCCPWALWYRRRIARVYFILANLDHKDAIEGRLRTFFDSSVHPWAKDFTPVDCNLLRGMK